MADFEDGHRSAGQLIDALLKERRWTKRGLAVVLETSEASVNRLVADKVTLSPEMALQLEEVFGVEAERFLSLAVNHELQKARLTHRPNPDRARRASLFCDLPIAEMMKRGWLDADDARDVALVEKALSEFFEAPSADEIELLPHSAKKTEVFAGTSPVQLAWLYRARAIARDMLVPKYTPSLGRTVVARLRDLLMAAEEARKVPRLLAESGIRFVVVESLPGAKIDGACFWLNDSSPVVAMSCRYDRIDNFWFVLRHELEHVLRGHGKQRVALDVELEGARAGTDASLEEEERVANEAAADFCVPQDAMERFIARKSPFFADRDIQGFARTLKIHPGLVAGQLQHRTGKYNRFRDHLVKVRSIVAPGAMVDGWGDVAPVGD